MTLLLAMVILHTASTLVMTGLIWFVQIVHYPLFALVGDERFAAYERQHQRRTTWIVGPAMSLETGSAIALVILTRGMGTAAAMSWIGAGLLAIIWCSTAMVQVPCHRRLARSFDASVASHLVRTNWLRTLGWSLRGVLAMILSAVVSGAGS